MKHSTNEDYSNVKSDVFVPVDILLPLNVSGEMQSKTLNHWSVIACDQFSSEKNYWERVKNHVGSNHSTLNMIIPEAYLDDINEETEIRNIRRYMEDTIKSGILKKLSSSFIYVERTQSDGDVRRGIVGAVDLEHYDYKGSQTAICASEGTVIDRLPPRVKIRSSVPLELPHIITFINDIKRQVIEPLSEKTQNMTKLYDFELMEGGGHIKGWQITGALADEIRLKIGRLHDEHDASIPLMIMGDGNHSLAAAKVYWDELKESLSPEERDNHPAGKALVEVNNVYDEAIKFEAIHRVMYGVNPDKLAKHLNKTMRSGGDYTIKWVTAGKSGEMSVGYDSLADMLTSLQESIDEYLIENGGTVDYIHGVDSVVALSASENSFGLILPSMEKTEFFNSVISKGIFPKKSFSVGSARDKRYYLECRGIK